MKQTEVVLVAQERKKFKLYLNAIYGASALRICHNLLSPFKINKWLYLDIRSMYPIGDDYTSWVWLPKKDLCKSRVE